MFGLDSGTLIAFITILAPLVAIVLGAITPAVVEGLAVLKALDGMTRQPETAGNLRGTLIIAMALLESTAIYVLLICLVILFATAAGLGRTVNRVMLYISAVALALFGLYQLGAAALGAAGLFQ